MQLEGEEGCGIGMLGTRYILCVTMYHVAQDGLVLPRLKVQDTMYLRYRLLFPSCKSSDLLLLYSLVRVGYGTGSLARGDIWQPIVELMQSSC